MSCWVSNCWESYFDKRAFVRGAPSVLKYLIGYETTAAVVGAFVPNVRELSRPDESVMLPEMDDKSA